MKDVPYIVFESEMARLERIIKRLFILVIISVVLLIGTNASWLWHENQFIDEVTVTQENDDGHNNYVGGDGTIDN